MGTEIQRAAVLGAGVMGSGIAAHLANAGIPVVLLDIVPPELTEEDEKKGLTKETRGFGTSSPRPDSKASRNRSRRRSIANGFCR